MLVLEILFILFLIFWALVGLSGRPATDPANHWVGPLWFGSTFFPWACVAILGYVLFHGPM
jgi:hypothetical protein